MHATGRFLSTTGGASADRGAVVAIVYATSVAIVMLDVAPAAERYLREAVHLSSGRVGALFAVELAAMGLASFAAPLWFGRADARGLAGFAACCGVLLFAWNFCVPSIFGAVAGRDPTGRLMSVASAAFAFGLALGPLLAGATVESLALDALFPCAAAGVALGVALTLRITGASTA